MKRSGFLEINNIYLEPSLIIDQTNRHEAYYHIYKYDTKEHIGNCGLRLDDTDMNSYLGNIEYEIFEPYRGFHYAKQACLLLGSIARDKGVHSLTITANIHNQASLHVIESLQAKFVHVVRVPKKCRLYRQKDRKLAVYQWNIEEKRNQL